nr:oligosaccharide flippase family protein [Bacteroidota bacterium]
MSTRFQIKQLLSDSVVYGLTGMLNRFITMFFVPVYSRILMPADYGVMNLINIIFMAVTIIVVCGFDGATMRWYYDEKEEQKQNACFASWFWFQLMSVLLLSVVVYFCIPVFTNLVFDTDVRILFLIQIANLFFSILPLILQIYFRAKRNPKQYLRVALSNTVMSIGFTILFLVVLRMGIKGVFIATLISNVIISIYAIYRLRDVIKWQNLNSILTKKMLRYSLPLIPTSISYWVLNGSANFFVKHYSGISEAGLYAIGMQLGAAVALVTSAFQMAWSAFAFDIKDSPTAKNTYALVLTLYMIISTFMALGVSLFSREVLVILTTPPYYDAYSIGCIYAFHAISIGLAYIAFTGISIMKTTSPYARAVFISSILSLILYYMFTPLFGKVGAGFATLIGYTLIPIIVFYESQKAYPIQFNFKLAIFLFVFAALLASSIIFLKEITVLNVCIKITLISIYGYTCYMLLKKYNQPEMEKVMQAIKSKLNRGEK